MTHLSISLALVLPRTLTEDESYHLFHTFGVLRAHAQQIANVTPAGECAASFAVELGDIDVDPADDMPLRVPVSIAPPSGIASATPSPAAERDPLRPTPPVNYPSAPPAAPAPSLSVAA